MLFNEFRSASSNEGVVSKSFCKQRSCSGGTVTSRNERLLVLLSLCITPPKVNIRWLCKDDEALSSLLPGMDSVELSKISRTNKKGSIRELTMLIADEWKNTPAGRDRWRRVHFISDK